MALANMNTTVTTTGTTLAFTDGDYIGGVSLAMSVPTGGSTVFIGPPGVTPATGYPINAGETQYLDVDPLEKLALIVASGTQVVYVLARGV